MFGELFSEIKGYLNSLSMSGSRPASRCIEVNGSSRIGSAICREQEEDEQENLHRYPTPVFLKKRGSYNRLSGGISSGIKVLQETTSYCEDVPLSEEDKYEDEDEEETCQLNVINPDSLEMKSLLHTLKKLMNDNEQYEKEINKLTEQLHVLEYKRNFQRSLMAKRGIFNDTALHFLEDPKSGCKKTLCEWRHYKESILLLSSHVTYYQKTFNRLYHTAQMIVNLWNDKVLKFATLIKILVAHLLDSRGNKTSTLASQIFMHYKKKFECPCDSPESRGIIAAYFQQQLDAMLAEIIRIQTVLIKYRDVIPLPYDEIIDIDASIAIVVPLVQNMDVDTMLQSIVGMFRANKEIEMTFLDIMSQYKLDA